MITKQEELSDIDQPFAMDEDKDEDEAKDQPSTDDRYKYWRAMAALLAQPRPDKTAVHPSKLQQIVVNLLATQHAYEDSHLRLSHQTEAAPARLVPDPEVKQEEVGVFFMEIDSLASDSRSSVTSVSSGEEGESVTLNTGSHQEVAMLSATEATIMPIKFTITKSENLMIDGVRRHRVLGILHVGVDKLSFSVSKEGEACSLLDLFTQFNEKLSENPIYFTYASQLREQIREEKHKLSSRTIPVIEEPQEFHTDTARHEMAGSASVARAGIFSSPGVTKSRLRIAKSARLEAESKIDHEPITFKIATSTKAEEAESTVYHVTGELYIDGKTIPFETHSQAMPCTLLNLCESMMSELIYSEKYPGQLAFITEFMSRHNEELYGCAIPLLTDAITCSTTNAVYFLNRMHERLDRLKGSGDYTEILSPVITPGR